MHDQDRDKDLIIAAHRAQWKTFWKWLAFVVALALAEGLTAWTVHLQLWWLTVPAIVLAAHLMHSQLLAFHEAAHGSLCPVRWMNDAVGIAVGKFHFIGFTLFRTVHHSHHAHLGTVRDEQLWPLVDPTKPRWARRLAAAFELSMGMLFDAMQFWRSFLRKGSPVQNRRTRRRIWLETALIVAFWGLVAGGILYVGGTGKYLLFLYVIPAFLAGNMHSWRKYVEHVGLFGSSPRGLTRSVVAKGWLGRLLAFSLFNVSYHGVHHYYSQMPQGALPRFAELLQPQSADEQPVYSSYWRAWLDMVPTLVDPRVGPQWRSGGKIQELA